MTWSQEIEILKKLTVIEKELDEIESTQSKILKAISNLSQDGVLSAINKEVQEIAQDVDKILATVVPPPAVAFTATVTTP